MIPIPFITLVAALLSFWQPDHSFATIPKINGVNFVAPPREVKETCMLPVKQLRAGWIALNPYAFSRKNKPEIIYNVDQQWWGEKPDGVRACIRFARQQGLKVMIKPHIWVEGQGWAGDFTLDSEQDWQTWERHYERYVLEYATLAAAEGIEMFCIGTEFRQAVKQRPQFWKNLITKVRSRYKGPLTYAANWDEYRTVPFWDQLDYIGIDAYFPISDETTPTVDNLLTAWKDEANRLKSYAGKVGRPVLFTEYGYRSVDKTAGKQWELPESWNSTAPVNLTAQANAYEALYRTFWHQPWFAGGFLWKWYDDHVKAGGHRNDDYTPQRKPAEGIIRKYYGQS